MDTERIYKQVMLDEYFNKVKYLRNSWDENTAEKIPGLASIIDIGGKDYRQYEFIMNTCNHIVFNMLASVIKELIREYQIPVEYYDLRSTDATLCYVGKDKKWDDYIDQRNEKQVLSFSITDKNNIPVLCIFKKFGIKNRIPQKTIDGLMKAAKLKKYCYISYVEEDAFAEVINHNKDDHDPSRGTGIFSLKQFFEGFFGNAEYCLFKKYANHFSNMVQDYLGFTLIRALKRNVIPVFKKQVLNELQMIGTSTLEATKGIEQTQRDIIEKHFITEKNYEVLLGNSDFARSFVTAEWLYSSLSKAGNIDLTAIAMGYFKSIEQLLFHFITLHTKEKDGHSRQLYVGHKKYANISGYVDLTESLVNDQDKVKDITLGGLTGFFGHYNDKTHHYSIRNQDLLVPDINSHTSEFIIDTLSGIVGLRNGYFHKDNLEEWGRVKEARDTALLVYYLVLGAYTLSENDKTCLGIVRVDDHDDYYKLCAYINRKAYDNSKPLSIPIFYVDGTSDPYAFVLPHQDDYIEYDNYGEPIYSGVYYKGFGKNRRVSKISKDSLPKEIWEGSFVISESVPIKWEPSGAEKRIFYDGKYVVSDD